jgi:hypothetical protein
VDDEEEEDEELEEELHDGYECFCVYPLASWWKFCPGGVSSSSKTMDFWYKLADPHPAAERDLYCTPLIPQARMSDDRLRQVSLQIN